MAEPLATVQELEVRLGEPLTGGQLAMAEAALNDASAVVRAYGLPWPDPSTAPDIARSITLSAAERRMRNPEGYRSEIEGSYQYHRPASAPLGVELTKGEIRMLAAAGGLGGVYSVPIASPGGTL